MLHGGGVRPGALCAHRLVQHGAALVVHQRHRAGQHALVHMGLKYVAQACQGGWVHGFLETVVAMGPVHVPRVGTSPVVDGLFQSVAASRGGKSRR
ncbi:hypothetical protein GmRootA79_29630 [Acidovorax sp. A79]